MQKVVKQQDTIIYSNPFIYFYIVIITIIGSGNIATFFANKWYEAGFNILQVYSKHLANAKLLAVKVNADAIDDIDSIDNGADIYLVALPDDISKSIIPSLKIKNKKIVICAGSLALSEIDSKQNELASIWPIYSINKNLLPQNNIQVPLTYTCTNDNNCNWVHLLSEKISTHYFPLNDNKKSVLHLAATMANNFTNHIFTLCYELCLKYQLNFKYLLPLIENTVSKLNNQIPSALQTGPAKRKDYTTMEKHKILLDNELHKKLYEIISESIEKSNI